MPNTRTLPSKVSLDLGLLDPDEPAAVAGRVARKLGCSVADLPELTVIRRTLDARRGKITFHLEIALDPELARNEFSAGLPPKEVKLPSRVVIVGDGPAGLFCAYELARHGIASTVIERGKLVRPRRLDLVSVLRQGRVNEDSNYCFGEGGAGTYSDGKLYTRSTKRGNTRDVLGILASHGAPEQILVDARPHIGSNRLPKVITALREHLQSVGVAFRFGAKVVGLAYETSGGQRRVCGVRIEGEEDIPAQHVVLATGHSARDVYEWLDREQVRLEAKPFAVGVRIEHPQALINRIQYGKLASHPKLPNADYHLAYTEDGRGVFSFCMCPGGFIVPAATESDGVVVNGMSLSRRDSPFANSGMVVGVEPADLEAVDYTGPLAGIAFQREIERAAFTAGGGAFRAPASRVTDFLEGRVSRDLPASSYKPGLQAADLAWVLDRGKVPLASRLKKALHVFGGKMRGYLSKEAVLVGVESRTSSPVRIPRDAESLQHPDVSGLYPAGEGGGHAGGIVSAALDGMRIAQIIAGQPL
jgi:uncharacterized FAD-dependent dehydrogenase